jgi:hypothetical protein
MTALNALKIVAVIFALVIATLLTVLTYAEPQIYREVFWWVVLTYVSLTAVVVFSLMVKDRAT